MREPKRLAHRQAERNKARALKQWSWDQDEDEAETDSGFDVNAVLVSAEQQLTAINRRVYSY
jgi:hypothetical protein